MIKIILLSAIFVSSTFLGFQISKVFNEKTAFHQDLLDFTKNLKTEISFFKTDIVSILSKYTYKSKFENIKEQIKNLYNSKNQLKIDDINSILTQNITLDETEQKIISQMFFELGQLDYVCQLEQLDYYKNQFETMLTKSKNRADKMIPFCKKIGILTGLLVCIVLI